MSVIDEQMKGIDDAEHKSKMAAGVALFSYYIYRGDLTKSAVMECLEKSIKLASKEGGKFDENNHKI